MDKLSERLWVMRVSLPNLEDSELATLDEAIKQIERYEDAPVGDCYRHPHLGPFAECLDEHVGQRVRIVLDKEG